MSVLSHRHRRPSATERLRGLDRRAGAQDLLDAAYGPSIEVARRALGWLAHDGGPAERDALRQLVWTCDHALVEDVATTLKALGDRDTLETAGARLGAGPTAERCRAARVLAQFADRRAIPALCRALTDIDASVRCAALDALGRVGSDRVAACAAATLLADPSADVRRCAVRAIGHLSDDPAPVVRAVIEDSSPAVRREVAYLSARASRKDVARLLADRHVEVRRAAAAHAGRGAEEALASVLGRDPHPSVRLAAARRLGLLGGEDAVRALVAAALDDADAIVRAGALRGARCTLSESQLAARVRAELESVSASRRRMAIHALAKLPASICETAAVRLAHDADPSVRLALAQRVAVLVDEPSRVFDVLTADLDPAVRHAAWVHQRADVR